MYQYSNKAPRLLGQTSIFGVVFFVSKSLLGIERQKKVKKITILTRKPRSHVRILIYRIKTWPIAKERKTMRTKTTKCRTYFEKKGRNHSSNAATSAIYKFSKTTAGQCWKR